MLLELSVRLNVGGRIKFAIGTIPKINQIKFAIIVIQYIIVVQCLNVRVSSQSSVKLIVATWHIVTESVVYNLYTYKSPVWRKIESSNSYSMQLASPLSNVTRYYESNGVAGKITRYPSASSGSWHANITNSSIFHLFKKRKKYCERSNTFPKIQKKSKIENRSRFSSNFTACSNWLAVHSHQQVARTALFNHKCRYG